MGQGQVISMETGRQEPLVVSDETREMKLYDIGPLVAAQVLEPGVFASFYMDATQAEAAINWLTDWLSTQERGEE